MMQDAADQADRRNVALLRPAGRVNALLSLPVVYGAILVLFICAASRIAIVSGDTWWHLVFGERILSTGSWPTSGVYSFTAPNEPWIAYEWLGEVLMAAAMRAAGFHGLGVLLACLGGLFVALLYIYSYEASRSAKAAFASCLILFPLVVPFLALRPQLIGYILLLVVLICLEKHHQGKERSLLLVPLVFLAWVNIHGSFVIGFGALILSWLAGIRPIDIGTVQTRAWSIAQRQRLALAGLMSMIAMLVTPYGRAPFLYPFTMMSAQPVNIGKILEWQALGFDRWWGQMFLLLLLVFLLSQIFFAQRHRLDQVVLLLFGIYAAARHGRFLIVFVIIFAPLLAGILSRWFPDLPSAGKPKWNLALLVAITLAAALIVPRSADVQQAVAGRFPSATVEYLRQNPSLRRTFNELEWGGYLIWSLGPSRPVFIDGRTDFYESAGVLQKYFEITQTKLVAPLLIDQYELDAFLLRRESALGTLLSASGQWTKASEDAVSVLYVRRVPLPRPVSSRSVLAQTPSVDTLQLSDASFVSEK